jgi:hypothetical protein
MPNLWLYSPLKSIIFLYIIKIYLTIEDVKDYVDDLPLDDLHLKGETIIAHNFVEQHGISERDQKTWINQVYRFIAKRGIDIARDGYNLRNRDLTQIGLGIAACAAETRGVPIVINNNTLGGFGLHDAGTWGPEFQKLSTFANFGVRQSSPTAPAIA